MISHQMKRCYCYAQKKKKNRRPLNYALLSQIICLRDLELNFHFAMNKTRASLSEYLYLFLCHLRDGCT